MQKVFITGGAGFVGSNLIHYLLDQGEFECVIYDNLSEGSEENINIAVRNSKGKGSASLIKGDILDFKSLRAAMAGCQSVVHLAAFTRVVESIKDPSECIRVNTDGTFNVLEAARINNVQVVVFASSNAAVGRQIPPINEDMVPAPMSPYGAVKLYGEALCSAYFHSYDLKTVALRFANVYGPYSSHKTSVVAKFLRNIRQGSRLEIYGDGTQTRDFVHSRDIAQAIYRVLTYGGQAVPWGQVFQIASGRETRIIDLARTLLSISGTGDDDFVFTPAVKGEIAKNFSDISRSREVLGFEPVYELEKSLQSV